MIASFKLNGYVTDEIQMDTQTNKKIFQDKTVI